MQNIKSFKDFVKEDAPANATGAAIAGTSPGETPPVFPKRKKKDIISLIKRNQNVSP